MSPLLKNSWPHSPGEAVLLLRVLWMLHQHRRHGPSESLRSMLDRLTPSDQRKTVNNARVQKAACYVDAICSRLPYLSVDACMPRSLTLYRIARESGLDAVWNCGVRKTAEGRLDGHAWLTLGGAPYLEPDDRAKHYTVTFQHPATEAASNASGPRERSRS